MWCAVFSLLVVGLSVVRSEDDGWRTVSIAQGPLRGRRDAAGELFSFFNIPYATAPNGKNKFKGPLPPPKWTEPFDAIDRGIICPQATFESPEADALKNKSMQEDCLVANVFVPDTEEKHLPVVVYVHGGAFQVGFGDWLRVTNLVNSKKLIAVNFNYRLGIHGFLCLGTKGASGNGGMKDQVALLKWVQQNIASFGGNPNDVTLVGYSAGAAAVDLLILSKSSKGLFHKVIVESGASIAPFTIQPDPVESAKEFARSQNFTNVDDINALEEFYEAVSYETLTLSAFLDRPDSSFLFSPCVERDIGDDVFLDDDPVNILKKGEYTKVPMLYGFTNMEGLFRIPFFELWIKGMNEKFSDFLPVDLLFKNADQKNEVAQRVKEFYFGNETIDINTILGYVDYFTDTIFASPVLRSVKLNVEAGNDQIYVFEYSFADKNTPYVQNTEVRGARHCAETLAVCDSVGSDFDESEQYKNMRKTMRELWTNFITTGKPVLEGSSLPTWPAAAADGSPYMSLGVTVELAGVPLERRAKFWENIYEENYRKPVPPPKQQNLS